MSAADHSPEAADVPRTFRVSTGWRLLLALAGCGMLLFAIPFARLARPVGGSDAFPPAVWIAIAAALGALGVRWLACAFLIKLELTADAVCVSEPFGGARRLRRSEILGYRIKHTEGGIAGIILYPNRGDLKRVNVQNMYHDGGAIKAWLVGLQDLDAAEAQGSQEAILSNYSLGATTADRQAKLDLARRRARWADGVVLLGLAACLWVPVPQGPLLAALALLPWIAIGIVRRSGGLYGLWRTRNTVAASLFVPLASPGLGLALAAVRGVHFVSESAPRIWAVAIAGVLAIAAWRADRSIAHAGPAQLAAAIAFLFYGYGAVAFVDGRLDADRGNIHRAVVTQQRVGDGFALHITLGPWGPFADPVETMVPRTLFLRLSVGDTACVTSRGGALGIPWYAIAECDDPPSSR